MAGLHPLVVVTGATGAIGSATATALARRGARVTLMARPTERLDTLLASLDGYEGRVTALPIDISSLSSVRMAARDIIRTAGHIDALLNVAGTFSLKLVQTRDDFEVMLATNHLGPFLLTNLLRDRLVGGGRVITVAAPSSTRVNLDQLLSRDHFSALRTFGATKAANLLFTFELARRAKRWDVRANAYHPGLVRSDLMRESPAPIRLITRAISRHPRRAGEDLAELALSPAFEGTTGWFFKGTRRIDPPKGTLDTAAHAALWKRTAELVELDNSGF
jgi:NAD(P)-dependent dehydrogenase (short-subunit alcohol dehydrogenase family)